MSAAMTTESKTPATGRYAHFKHLISAGRELRCGPASIGKLLASYYLSRIQSLRSIAPRAFRVTVKCRGKNVRVLLRPNGVDYAVLHDVFVKELYRSAMTGVKTIVDLGANIGISTLYLNALYPAAQIVSVEPFPGNIEMLREMIALNGLLESVTVIPQAVGVQDGTAVLNISPDPTANSLVPRNRGDKSLEVAQIAMATLMRQMQWPRIDVLKIDIEGYEKTLFRENTEWLSKTRFIVGEGHGHVGYDFGAVERDLSMYGFKLTHEYQDPQYEIFVFSAQRA